MAPRGGRAGIRKAMQDAETMAPPIAIDSDSEAAGMRVSGGRLVMRPSGLCKLSDEDKVLPIAGAFEVLSQTVDDDSAWGLMLRFCDPDGAVQHVVVRRDHFASEGGELRNMLARRGLYVNPSRAASGLLAEWLSRAPSTQRARIVGQIGWHRIAGIRCYVLPNQTFGTPPVEVVYQPATGGSSLFNAAGTLEDWQERVAQPCVGNSRLVFAVSAAFAAPLLELVGEDGGGLHFRAKAQVGKTTALRLAASVWGGEGGRGAAGYVRQWRATDNAMEGLALAHSDALLPLDELGQADPRTVGDTAYLLSAGLGKARSDRQGGLRVAPRFRVLFLSTGEVSLADRIAEAGRRVKAGQEVRVIDVPADAGRDMGILEELHGTPDAVAFIQDLNGGIKLAYGTAAPAFISHLMRELSGNTDLIEDLRAWLRDLVAQFTAGIEGMGGQVASVARRFALVGLGGEMATAAEITRWPANEATEAARRCFRDWLAARGTAGAREDSQAVVQLRDFITRHGDARFQEWRTPQQEEPDSQAASTADPDGPQPPPANERFRTVNRAGWKRRESDTPDGVACWHFYLTAAGWAEALDGLDRQQAAKALRSRGFIKPAQDGRSSASLSPPGHPKVRLYHILPAILDVADAD